MQLLHLLGLFLRVVIEVSPLVRLLALLEVPVGKLEVLPQEFNSNWVDQVEFEESGEPGVSLDVVRAEFSDGCLEQLKLAFNELMYKRKDELCID